MAREGILAILALGIVIILGCTQSVEAGGKNPARLFLKCGQGGTRSFAPQNITIAGFRITGNGPGGATIFLDSENPSVSLELLPGAWRLSAEGRSSAGEILAAGSIELVLEPGERRNATIVLLPLEGEGSLCLSWSLEGDPGSGCRIEGSLSSSSGEVIPLASPVEAGQLSLTGLEAGSYSLELGLFDGENKLCGLAESVLIVTGMETTATISFSPPTARLGLGCAGPDFLGPSLSLVPLRRRIAPGSSALFGLSSEVVAGNWYVDGSIVGSTGELIAAAPALSRRRIDWLGDAGGLGLGSARGELRVGENVALGPLAWTETLGKGDLADSPNARALDDCRDLGYSSDGSLAVAVGREGNALGIFSFASCGSIVPISGLSNREEPLFVAPNRLVVLPAAEGCIALSDSAGAVYRIGYDSDGSNPRLEKALYSDELLGASDMAVAPGAEQVYLAAPGAEALFQLDPLGDFGELLPAARAGDPGLELFAEPRCIALSQDGNLLALGTAGDDALYLFSRDGARGILSLNERIPKESLAAFASLSDPVSLAFSPDGESLFVLSYYGKAVIRLDRDQATGGYVPRAAAKSGTAGIGGFASPKRLALSPDGDLLLVTGSGANDGLSAFSVGQAEQLDYLGTLHADGSDAVLEKPIPLAFDPQKRRVLLASGEKDRLAVYSLAP